MLRAFCVTEALYLVGSGQTRNEVALSQVEGPEGTLTGRDLVDAVFVLPADWD